MPKLYMITVSGLEVPSDWRPVRERLLESFPEVSEVLATTIPETILIAYSGAARVDAWLHTVGAAITARRQRMSHPLQLASGAAPPARRARSPNT